MKAKRILAVLLSTAVLSASLVVGTALTTSAEEPSTAPSVGEIQRPEFVPMEKVSVLVRADGTTILPKEAGFGRLNTNHTYNANDMSMKLDNIRFGADADDNAAVVVGFTKDKGGWYDGPSLFFSFTKGGAVKLFRGREFENNTPYKTETGFDFSEGVDFTLKLDGDTYTLTVNGKAVTFPASDLDGQSESGLNMAATPLAFGTTGNVTAFRIASITGGEAGSTGGEFLVEDVEYTPTADADLKKPENGEIMKADIPGVDATVTDNQVQLNAGRVTTKSTYYMNDAKLVLTDVTMIATGYLDVAFASKAGGWFDDTALIFELCRSGDVKVIKGRGVGGAEPFMTFTSVFDANEGRIELGIKLEGDNYVVTVNEGSLTIPVSQIEELFAPVSETVTKEPLNPEAAYIVFSQGGGVSFTVASIDGERELAEFTPTPADQLKNPPAEGDIHNLWSVPNVTIGEATQTGTKITFSEGASAAGTRVGTKGTYDLDTMRVVINGMEGNTGVRVTMTSEDNGWTDKYSVMVNINPDNTISVAKYYVQGKGTNAIITSVPITTSVDEVIELTFRLVGEEYVLTVNGQEIKIAAEQLEDVFAEGRLQYDAVYLAFGIAADGAGAYNVADITGTKNDTPVDEDPDNTDTGVTALPIAAAAVMFVSAALAAVTLKKKKNA